jgi:hypothetical protein
MLVPLFLWQQGLIRATAWCRYFLEALRAQAEANHAVAMSIIELYAKLKRDAVEWTRTRSTRCRRWIGCSAARSSRAPTSFGGIQMNSPLRPLDDERRPPMLVLGGSSEVND